jgi:O-glycosyl hydrolase
MRTLALIVTALTGLPVTAAERAGYDSRGRIIALLSDGGEVEVYSNYVAVGPNGKRTVLLERQVRGGPRNQGQLKSWAGTYGAPESGQFRLEWKTEDGEAGLRYSTTVTPESGEFRSVELVLDLPRDVFVGGRLTPAEGSPVPLSPARHTGAALYSGQTQRLRFEDAAGRIAITIALDGGREVTVIDRWDVLGTAHIIPNMPLDEGGQSGTMYYGKTRRSYQVRIPLMHGPAEAGAKANLTGTFSLENKSVAPPARLSVDAGKARYYFDGFGANFCWDNSRGATRPIQEYLLKALKSAWARTEMKIQQWDRNRENPPQDVRYDLDTMRRLQQMGIPYVISIWRLPDRFHIDPAAEPKGARGRAVDPTKWDELAQLLVDYLLYAKKEYGVEPDMLSFNEGNIGVNVRLTPEEHTLQIKLLGAAFEKAGLKTKMLLGDAVPARDTHIFALDAASDPEALRYIAGVAFHSWGGATPRQYAAWGDLAEWLKVPLLVTELGVDSQSFATNAWDNYHHGLREAQFTQEMLIYARPQGTQFWQYTDDYALVKVRPDGTIEPTARFWMMKHFTDLTPLKSEALSTTSDQNQVFLTAFRKNGSYAMHIVNRGGTREATLSGAPDGEWTITESTEARQFDQSRRVRSGGGAMRLQLPARSLVTLTMGGSKAGN